MVLILDFNSEIGAHAWSKIDNLNYLRHFFGTKAVSNSKFILKYQ